MFRAIVAALTLASPLSAQVISVKTSVPVFSGAPGVVSFQAPALNTALPAPSLAAGLTPSLGFAPSALVPVLAAPAVPVAVQPQAVAAAAVPVQGGARAIAPLRSAVRTFADGLRAIPAALGGLFDGAASVGDPSSPVAGAGFAVRTLESIKQLKMGSYNVENLFEQVGSHVPDPANPGRLKKISDAKPKPEWALRAEGKLILENDLDIVTLAEVEDVKALSDFNERFLDGKYRVFLIEGNDERGIDVAFLVKKDLPFEIEQRSHKEETWNDPTLPGAPRKLFSRDLTSLVVRAPGKAQPLFVLFGTHYKSKRDRPGDPESNIERAAQVQRTAEIMERYKKEFGDDVKMMIAGDFNGAVADEAAYKPLYAAAGLTDSFDAAPVKSSAAERITHTYHPRGGPAHYAQMDAILVSKSLRGTVQSAKVYRYKNPDGTERPLPKTYEERELNPSDHFPLLVTLDFAPIRGGVQDRTADLMRAYLSVENPRREAAFALATAYYDGVDSIERLGRKLAPDTRRQLDAMLAVLEEVVPRAAARRHEEPEINALILGFEAELERLDRSRAPLPAAPAPAAPRSAAENAADARAFADSAKAWLRSSGPAFDAKIAAWTAWTLKPGPVDAYTLVHLPEVRTLIDALREAKLAFAREAGKVPATGTLSPEDVRRLYDAWDELRDAGSRSLVIVGDSRDADLSRRGLISNVDQNTSGRHPGGLDVFLSPGQAVDWDAAYGLNDALRGKP